jgi:hypothetical protein
VHVRPLVFTRALQHKPTRMHMRLCDEREREFKILLVYMVICLSALSSTQQIRTQNYDKDITQNVISEYVRKF